MSQRFGTRGFTILDLRFTNWKLAAYAVRITNECLLPMVRLVMPHYDFSHRTLCLYIVCDYFPIIFGTHVAESTCVDLRFLIYDLRMSSGDGVVNRDLECGVFSPALHIREWINKEGVDNRTDGIAGRGEG